MSCHVTSAKATVMRAALMRAALLMLIIAALFGLLPALTQAQEDIPAESLIPGEVQAGEITLSQPAAYFTLSGVAEQPYIITVERLEGADFAPILLIYSPNGDVLAQALNPGGLGSLTTVFVAPANTDYLIQVMGVNGTRGTFSIAARAEIPPRSEPITLREGLPVQDRVTPDEPRKTYPFAASASSALRLDFTAQQAASSPALFIQTSDGQLIGFSRPNLEGSSFTLPAANGLTYEVIVIHSGADREEGFTLLLTPLSGGAAAGNQAVIPATASPPPAVTPTPPSEVVIPFNAPCSVVPIGDVGVNVRRGPGTAYDRISALPPYTTVPVTGRTAANDWWQVEYAQDLFGWVADEAVQRGGDCSGILIADFPPPPATMEEAMPEASPTPAQ